MVEGGSILHADHPRKWVIFARRFTVKRDEAHWPAVGMPENGRPYYLLGQSPAEGLTQWYRDWNSPFEMWPPIPLQWSPAFFKEEELHDLTRSRATSTS